MADGKPNPFEPPATQPARQPYWRRRPYRFRDDPFVWIYGMMFVIAMIFMMAETIYVGQLRNRNNSAPPAATADGEHDGPIHRTPASSRP